MDRARKYPMVEVATLINSRTSLGTAGSGVITLASTGDDTFTLTSATQEAGVDLISGGLATTFNDGSTSITRGSTARGLTAGALYADISTVAGANSALKTLDVIIADVNTARASAGATINRLEYAADNLSNVSQNTSASRSRVLDADYAAETTELARTQIIQQANNSDVVTSKSTSSISAILLK